jgi:hypothetical protein
VTTVPEYVRPRWKFYNSAAVDTTNRNRGTMHSYYRHMFESEEHLAFQYHSGLSAEFKQEFQIRKHFSSQVFGPPGSGSGINGTDPDPDPIIKPKKLRETCILLEGNCQKKERIRNRLKMSRKGTLIFSVGDPEPDTDPHIFGPPGSGYIMRYGSAPGPGSFPFLI